MCMFISRKIVSFTSVTDPDPENPYVFGPPGSGYVGQSYGSESFYQQAKKGSPDPDPYQNVMDPQHFFSQARMHILSANAHFFLQSANSHFFQQGGNAYFFNQSPNAHFFRQSPNALFLWQSSNAMLCNAM